MSLKVGVPRSVAGYLPGAVAGLRVLRKFGKPFYVCLEVVHVAEEPHRIVVAFLPYVRHLIGVVLAEYLVHRNVEADLQDEHVSPAALCGEDGIAVIAVVQQAPHGGDGAVLADFNHGAASGLPAQQAVQNVTVYRGIVVGKFYKVVHITI